MRTQSVRSVLAVVALVAAIGVACDVRSPGGPSSTAGIPSSATGTAGLGGTPFNLGGCLGREGDPSCFEASRTRVAASSVSAPATAPGAPSSLACSVSGSLVEFSWAAGVGGDPVTTYRLQAGSAPGLLNYADFMTLSTDRIYIAYDVFPGTYYVRVLAVNAANQSSPASNEVVVIVGTGAGCSSSGTPPPPSPGCPTAPLSLVNASQSAGTISLTWSAPSSGRPTSYVIVAGSAPGLSDLANFDTGSTALSYLATGVPAGSYYVRVYSKSSCGSSSASNEVLVYVVGFTSDVQVSVSWDAPTDVDLHVVEPNGTEIYWGNTSSSTGGRLDVDSNPACTIDGRQIENIRWTGTAPAGVYTVRVDYWSGCSVSVTNYLVTVKNGSSTQTFSGSFTGSGDSGGLGSGRTITTFTHASLGGIIAESRLFQLPALRPSPEKLRLSGKR